MSLLGKVLAWAEALIRHACSLAYIREYAGPNAGEGVTAAQASTHNKPPDYWCMSYVYWCVRRICGKVLLCTASCSEQRVYAAKHGALRAMADFWATVTQKGPEAVLCWVMLEIDPQQSTPGEVAAGLKGHAHHTGLVGAVRDSDDAIITALPDNNGFVTTEGNAADPRKPASRDGNGVYKGRVRGNKAEVTYKFDDFTRTYAPDPHTYEFIDLEALP